MPRIEAPVDDASADQSSTSAFATGLPSWAVTLPSIVVPFARNTSSS